MKVHELIFQLAILHTLYVTLEIGPLIFYMKYEIFYIVQLKMSAQVFLCEVMSIMYITYKELGANFPT